MSRLQKFELLSENAISNSPSRKDGVSPEMEANRRRIAARHIYETGHTFQMSVGTSAIAVTFFLRYFTRKSIKRNEPFIIAAGCLFLAGKVNDEPMPAQNIVVEMFKRWYGRDNPAMRQRLADKAFVQNLFASALEAERAILYTIGFDFNVDLPHTHIALLLRRPRFEYLKPNTYFHQLAINFCNDIMRKDGTMILQYSPREVALAVYYYLFKAAKRENLNAIPQPEPEPDGVPWFSREGLTVERCAEITQRINSLYHAPGAAASSQPAASAATTVMPGLSVGAAGGAESAAGGSAAAGAAVAGEEGVGGAVDSAAQQPSPAPPLLLPPPPQQQPPSAGQKRGLDDVTGAPAAKAPRIEPAGAAQAPRSSAASMPSRPTEGRAPAPAATPQAAPTQGTQASQAASTAAPDAAPGQPVEGSDKEEGELEEGELA